MTTRKPKPAADLASDMTKREVFAALVMAGIFAGPAGQAVLESHDDSSLSGVADVAFRMADLMANRSAA